MTDFSSTETNVSIGEYLACVDFDVPASLAPKLFKQARRISREDGWPMDRRYIKGQRRPTFRVRVLHQALLELGYDHKQPTLKQIKG